ncbi:MAG TPA: hypothetical protein VMD91_17925 [Candidatus Sulfotelmatobacter sp.]|nr:hypothetical protein [Candidatus Sulfotelmatobacter sp.]
MAWIMVCPGPIRAADEPSLRVPVLDPAPSMEGTLDPSWSKAAELTLDHDFTYKRAPAEPTHVYVGQDGAALDVAFVVTQAEAVVDTQTTNGTNVTSDDYVIVYLWPRGTQGFSYSFAANPRGTRYQTSSENTAYTPQWVAVGHRTPTGYVVTMRIPLGVIRSGGSTHWKAQFARETIATNSLAVWTMSDRQQNANDPAFAGTLLDVGAGAKAATRPQPRAQIYGLGELTTPANGGSTARVGGDFSVPITPTASFFGTLHPDYSNVEIDQQTIAPNAFAYQYQEVRPFFTQASNAYDNMFNCTDCPTLLYTPAIPIFREGYAVEGTQGPLTFAAFDAIGDGRVDQSQALDYNVETKQSNVALDYQHTSVDTSDGLHDELTSFTSGYLDQPSHLFAYFNGALERGTDVANPAAADYAEGGFGFVNSTSAVVLNYQQLGPDFNPPDSFVTQNGITGYEFFAKKTLDFAPGAPLHDVYGQIFAARYHEPDGAPGQVQLAEQLNFDFRSLMTLHLFGGYEGVQTADAGFLPFDANGAEVGYKVATNTPTYVQYTGGPYYHGMLDAWNYISTIPLERKIHLRVEADRDSYFTTYAGELQSTQWLERVTLDWQFNRDTSFDLGLRRIIGREIPNAIVPPTFQYVNASNVTAAFHFLALHNEFYLVYGNPNSLGTTPALYLKWIRYIGAPKGT